MVGPSQSPRIPLLSPPLEEQTIKATRRSGSLTGNEGSTVKASAKEEGKYTDDENHTTTKLRSTSTTSKTAGSIEENDDLEAAEEDMIAIAGHETVLQDGGYRQVGGNALRNSSSSVKSTMTRRILINLALIASWFFFSTLMNLYNSWLFSRKRTNFSYPLFTTSIHMVVQFALSSMVMFFCRRNRKIVPRRRNGKRARPSMQDYMGKVMPCALATALDIGLSNLSLQTITLTFYTMCKSSNLAFVLLFAVIFGLEKLRLSLIGIITLITVGVIMMVAAETEFVLEGAIEVLTASAMGGLRWALMQMLLKRKKMGMSNPIATTFWLSPLMGAFMISGSLLIENWKKLFTSPFFSDAPSSFHTIGLLVMPGFIVFCMNLCEFSLIQRTSVITLSVAGIFKEILTIMISSTVFGDELTPINVTGLCVAILGIILYNYYKYRLLLQKIAEGGSFSGHGEEEDDDDDEDRIETVEGRHGSSYTELEGGEVPNGKARHVEGGISSIALSTGQGSKKDEEDESLLTEAERKRRREREEEAELGGWHSSGFERTGNGWDDGRGYDSDETA
ncbi:TPT-domain-containing protein [Meira miltonrushii]|uniref:TPT-domain-containing protein n=1 Tax=Meira miltonrushii TaxID=1280837 RepID=A0A316V710_9BASI|nr:TPT-domain-containing protein [Meira miltonrushii]PWN33316.1 TPT-domain-containing protein [Meira miltonrushii]